jgi:hypothetical protein
MRKWIWAAAVPLAAAGLVYAVGAVLPRDHVATAEAILPAEPSRVAGLVRTVEAQPQWRRGVEAIEVVERSDKALRYIERSAEGAIAFDFVEEEPQRRFRSTIADPSLPFGGHWIIALSPEGAGTRIRIEEHGSVRDPLYRFFSALVFGHHGTMNAYLADMRRALEPRSSAAPA